MVVGGEGIKFPAQSKLQFSSSGSIHCKYRHRNCCNWHSINKKELSQVLLFALPLRYAKMTSKRDAGVVILQSKTHQSLLGRCWTPERVPLSMQETILYSKILIKLLPLHPLIKPMMVSLRLLPTGIPHWKTVNPHAIGGKSRMAHLPESWSDSSGAQSSDWFCYTMGSLSTGNRICNQSLSSYGWLGQCLWSERLFGCLLFQDVWSYLSFQTFLWAIYLYQF